MSVMFFQPIGFSVWVGRKLGGQAAKTSERGKYSGVAWERNSLHWWTYLCGGNGGKSKCEPRNVKTDNITDRPQPSLDIISRVLACAQRSGYSYSYEWRTNE